MEGKGCNSDKESIGHGLKYISFGQKDLQFPGSATHQLCGFYKLLNLSFGFLHMESILSGVD